MCSDLIYFSKYGMMLFLIVKMVNEFQKSKYQCTNQLTLTDIFRYRDHEISQ